MINRMQRRRLNKAMRRQWMKKQAQMQKAYWDVVNQVGIIKPLKERQACHLH